MLDASGFSLGAFEAMPGRIGVSVYRKHEGGRDKLNTPIVVWNLLVSGWQMVIEETSGSLQVPLPGATGLTHHMAWCQYHRYADNSLIVRARDIVVNMLSGQQYECIRSSDPDNTLQILRMELVTGFTTVNLAEQS